MPESRPSRPTKSSSGIKPAWGRRRPHHRHATQVPCGSQASASHDTTEATCRRPSSAAMSTGPVPSPAGAHTSSPGWRLPCSRTSKSGSTSRRAGSARLPSRRPQFPKVTAWSADRPGICAPPSSPTARSARYPRSARIWVALSPGIALTGRGSVRCTARGSRRTGHCWKARPPAVSPASGETSQPGQEVSASNSRSDASM